MLTTNGTVVTRTTSTPKEWKKITEYEVISHLSTCEGQGCSCPRQQLVDKVDQFGRTYTDAR